MASQQDVAPVMSRHNGNRSSEEEMAEDILVKRGGVLPRTRSRITSQGEWTTGSPPRETGSTFLRHELRTLQPVWRPKPVRRAARFITLEAYTGVVREVFGTYFVATLKSQLHEGPDESVEIPVDEVSHPDQALLKEGAIFYWAIGYLDGENGQRSRTGVLKFRRLPPLTGPVTPTGWDSALDELWLRD